MPEEQLSSSDAYKKRFADYCEIYKDSCPDSRSMLAEPLMQMPKAGTNPDIGAARTALTRQVRYNDPKSRQQNVGVKNASK